MYLKNKHVMQKIKSNVIWECSLNYHVIPTPILITILFVSVHEHIMRAHISFICMCKYVSIAEDVTIEYRDEIIVTWTPTNTISYMNHVKLTNLFYTKCHLIYNWSFRILNADYKEYFPLYIDDLWLICDDPRWPRHNNELN